MHITVSILYVEAPILETGLDYGSITRGRGHLASSPGSLLKNGRRRKPGNIRGKICRLLAPWSGGTNQIIEIACLRCYQV